MREIPPLLIIINSDWENLRERKYKWKRNEGAHGRAHAHTDTTTHTHTSIQILEIETMKSNHANGYDAQYKRPTDRPTDRMKIPTKHCYVTQCIGQVIEPHLRCIQCNILFLDFGRDESFTRISGPLIRRSFAIKFHFNDNIFVLFVSQFFRILLLSPWWKKRTRALHHFSHCHLQLFSACIFLSASSLFLFALNFD